MEKITPFLWFDTQAEEAANFYVSIFNNSKIVNISRYPEGGPAPKGQVMVLEFEIEGQLYRALNAGPHFTFNPAVSFQVNCETQAEVDNLWEPLLEGGEVMACGWLKDKYGLCWQITPTILGELLSDPDPAKAGRVMQAMMGMYKIEIAPLLEAYNQQQVD